MELHLKNGRYITNEGRGFNGVVPRDLAEGDAFESDDGGLRIVYKKVKDENGALIVYSHKRGSLD